MKRQPKNTPKSKGGQFAPDVTGAANIPSPQPARQVHPENTADTDDMNVIFTDTDKVMQAWRNLTESGEHAYTYPNINNLHADEDWSLISDWLNTNMVPFAAQSDEEHIFYAPTSTEIRDLVRRVRDDERDRAGKAVEELPSYDMETVGRPYLTYETLVEQEDYPGDWIKRDDAIRVTRGKDTPPPS
jgi:hypothetical protein